MAPDKCSNFRLRGIPLSRRSRNEVRQLIQDVLLIESGAIAAVHSLATNPTERTTKVATLSFNTIPPPLSDRSNKQWIFPLPSSEDADDDDDDSGFKKPLVFDTHFMGFTPLQHTEQDDCRIDIIALSGLGGHAFGSFKERNGRFMWLRDALPLDLPVARILIYGYDTQTVESSSFQNLADLGRALQVDIRSVRGQEPSKQRPLIFIGHSLGGLVIKEAVVKMKEEGDEEDATALGCISAFVFFGVPHKGMATESLVPLIGDRPNRALLESLGKNSALLSRSHKEFKKAFGTKFPRIAAYFETEKSPTALKKGDKWEMCGPSEVLVDPASATCGSKDQHPVNRNHSEIVKYTSHYDEIYTRVRAMLEQLVSRARVFPFADISLSEEDASIFLTEEQEECLRSFSFPERDQRRNEICVEKGTCEWLRDYPAFRRWMSKHHGLFWVEGNPGSGKSFLMKYASEMMKKRNTGDIIVSFFFHGRGVPLQKSPRGFFHALLSILLGHFPRFLSSLTITFQHREKRFGPHSQGRWHWTEPELQGLTTQLLKQETDSRPVVIFVDALDECGNDSARALLAYFKELMDEVAEGGRVKVCVSSRHYPVLGVDAIPKVLVEERNDRDIRYVMKKRLRDIQPEEKRRKYEKEILMKVQGGFQWAILVASRVIEDNATGMKAEKLLEKIQTTPQALEHLYADILNGIKDSERQQTNKLFLWILFAERPLLAQELRDALVTDKDMVHCTISELRDHQDWNDSADEFEKRVKHLSRGLVEFRTRDVWEQYEPGGVEEFNREAQFIHQSVPDYLMTHFLEYSSTFSLAMPCLRGAAHFEISRSCLKYLTLREVLDGVHLSRGSLSARFPLAVYAVRLLFQHIRKVEMEGILQTDLLHLIGWYQQSELLERISALWKILDPENAHTPMGWPFIGATVIHVLIASGSMTTLKEFLQKDDVELDGTDQEGNTPLMIAIREGHHDMASALLSRSRENERRMESIINEDPSNKGMIKRNGLVDVNAENNDGDTPMSIAFTERADDVMLELMDRGAELRCIEPQKDLVIYAIKQRNIMLLDRFIKGKVDLDGAVYYVVKTVSFSDVDKSALQLLSLLLEGGAPLGRPQDHDYCSEDSDDEHGDDPYENTTNDPIHIASYRGKVEAVKLLLLYGAEAVTLNDEGENSIWHAMVGGQKRTLEILLKSNPSIVEAAESWAPFEEGVSLEDFDCEILMLLVSEGRFSDNSDNLHFLFRHAISTQQHSLTRVIVENYPDMVYAEVVDGGVEERLPALSYAFYTKDETLALLLINNGHDPITILDCEKQTPLVVAIILGFASVVKAILQKLSLLGNAEDGDLTAQAYAVVMGFPDAESAWLDENAREALRNISKIAPISTITCPTPTADPSHFQINNRGETALMYAVRVGNRGLVQVLLAKVDLLVNLADSKGQTALLHAIRAENSEIAKDIIEFQQKRGSEHSPNPDSKYPLWYAKQTDQHDIALPEAVDKKLYDIVRKLFQAGKVNTIGHCSYTLSRVPDTLVAELLRLPEFVVDFSSSHPEWLSEKLYAGVFDSIASSKDTLKTTIVTEYQQFAPIVVAVAAERAPTVELLLDSGNISWESLGDARFLAGILNLQGIEDLIFRRMCRG